MFFYPKKYQINLSRLFLQKNTNSGFTLIELLISALVGSIVVSTLLGLVVNLLETDQQNSVQNQIQQEMQAALDYISEDLKEAVYVYSGGCIQGQGTTTDSNFCPGIINHVPNITKSVPVLAFWKVEPLPKRCEITVNQVGDPCADFRIANRTFSLVVYYLRQNLASEPNWQGKARITRYVLSQFTVPSTPTNSPPETTVGYYNPTQAGTSFRTWPYAQNSTGQFANQQQSVPTANGGNNPVLVDYVDDNPNEPNTTTCPINYTLTPSDASLESKGLTRIRSFYACVNQQNQRNPDVIVYLRGNTHGRQGGYDKQSLPALQTHVIGRGVIDKDPSL